MVIIFLKTLEKKKGVDDRDIHTMSRGTTLFSCGSVEADRWLDRGQSCSIQQRAPCQSGATLESLWDVMPEPGSWNWAKEPSNATAITSLIRDLSLCEGGRAGPHPHTAPPAASEGTAAAEAAPAPAAPPSKRQCRSLSLSDDFGEFRSSWRPQGSRVWTAVEKRRCHSGGSVRGGAPPGGHFPAMQRSFSFSSPSRPSDRSLDLPFFNQRLPPHPQFTASPVSPTSPPSHHHHLHLHHQHQHQQQHLQHHHFLRPLSLSHEQISLPEVQGEEASEASSPDSTPELGRRSSRRAAGSGCLSRSRSQPCVLNDKKMAMKRRRPEEPLEQRPSLDLTKMTQNLQTFQSLSCTGFSAADGRQSSLTPPTLGAPGQPDSDFAGVPEPGLKSWHEADADEEEEEEEDSSYEELDSDSACSVDSGPAGGRRTLWKGDGGTKRDVLQLGGELDLDQIERN
ncbi:protein FAM53B-like isoform X2 [Nelusetta ayraudi]|uniref:protein FAM53B-like isoform X2 n=1 Tax=Nelusetta ayraudi TaxID=303726 RepID=UPI003F6E6178